MVCPSARRTSRSRIVTLNHHRAAPTLRLKDAQRQPLYSLGTVPRYNMIGKAFFVYWPSGFQVPGLPGLPILPNVGRMRLIR